MGAGTIAVSKANQNANIVYADPGSGGAAAPAFRSLVAAVFTDQPIVAGGAGAGSVTSVGLTMPAEFTVAGSARAHYLDVVWLCQPCHKFKHRRKS